MAKRRFNFPVAESGCRIPESRMYWIVAKRLNKRNAAHFRARMQELGLSGPAEALTYALERTGFLPKRSR